MLAWKSNNYYISWMFVCNLSYPACKRMSHIIFSAVICLAPSYIFPHYLINGAIFRKILLNTKCVSWFSLQRLSETFLILRRNERDMIKNVYRSSCKVPVIIVRFEWNLNFLDSFSTNTQITNLMKIRPVGDEMFHADGQTDMKLINGFRNFSNVPNKVINVITVL